MSAPKHITGRGLLVPLGDSSAELIKMITSAVRAADAAFEHSGGSSRHWVRDQFLPALEAAGLRVVAVNAHEELVEALSYYAERSGNDNNCGCAGGCSRCDAVKMRGEPPLAALGYGSGEGVRVRVRVILAPRHKSSSRRGTGSLSAGGRGGYQVPARVR